MQAIIKVKNLKTVFGQRVIHDGLNLTVKKGEIYGILGPSGSGKTTLLREMLLLEHFCGGSIEVLGYNLETISYNDAKKLRQKWGVLFQSGALFSSLNVGENIALPLREYSSLSPEMIDAIVSLKLDIVGLRQEDALLYPSQLSGGMKKKASLARALAMDPKLLFLDEPTSGLDPISAREFNKLIVKLRDILGLSIVMVSHDLQSIYDTIDVMAIIDNKKILYEGTLQNIAKVKSDFVKNFFLNSDRIVSHE